VVGPLCEHRLSSIGAGKVGIMVRAPIVLCLLVVGCATGESLDSLRLSQSGGGNEVAGAGGDGGDGGNAGSSSGVSGGGSSGASSGGGGAGTASLDAARVDVRGGSAGAAGSVATVDASDSGGSREGGACGAQQACGGNLKCECCSPGVKCVCTTECSSDGDCKNATDRCAKPHGDPGFCAADGYCG
jgi:hypothetical protein